MRAMSGRDSRRGKSIHQRSSINGYASHTHLPSLLYQWVDDALLKTHETKHAIALGFLTLIKNLMWVILQDAAVMITKGERDTLFLRNSNMISTVRHSRIFQRR